jgi:hypothetical protein
MLVQMVKLVLDLLGRGATIFYAGCVHDLLLGARATAPTVNRIKHFASNLAFPKMPRKLHDCLFVVSRYVYD